MNGGKKVNNGQIRITFGMKHAQVYAQLMWLTYQSNQTPKRHLYPLHFTFPKKQERCQNTNVFNFFCMANTFLADSPC